MPISLAQLTEDIIPERTVLFFGSGSSVPSNAPSVDAVKNYFAKKFNIVDDGYSLREFSSLVEAKTKSRTSMISALRTLFATLTPTGGLLNLPLYEWKSLFTTNYDDLIEQSYRRREVDLTTYSSNFDFRIHSAPFAVKLFKLHGSIEKDVSDGIQSRIIITDSDYGQTEEYRENLYDRLKADLAGSHLIIIGHSLADPDIASVVGRAVEINLKSGGAGRITLMLYTRDDNRALLYENRGIEVCFGGVDDFFAGLAKVKPGSASSASSSDDPLEKISGLVPCTVDVQYASSSGQVNVSSMFSGWPADYCDIASGLTFQRSAVAEIDEWMNAEDALTTVIVGASGVGKTTAARQVMLKFLKQGKYCWEHKGDHPLSVELWTEMMLSLKATGYEGVLYIDEAHSHLQQVNDLIDRAVSENCAHLKLVLSSTRNQWYPRIKTPNLYKYGKEWVFSQLRAEEIENLLLLVESNDLIRALVEPVFSGFSKVERRRRLVDRCEKDFFVCLKNIFASESMDDIILREFAALPPPSREIYRYVAAMENAGVRVHRQLIVRLLGIPAESVSGVLGELQDIVHEYDVDRREGVYGWRCRHSVIAGILTKYKFSDQQKTIELFEKVIDSISPTFDIEIRTIRELCNIDTGLPRVSNKETQNHLLRRMMSVAPGERVPRHRLIRNLIESLQFEKAETEIRIFTSDFGADGPVHRYRVDLMVARATKTQGILEEDRISLLEQAQELAVIGCDKFPNNRSMLAAYAELGIAYYKKTGQLEFFDDAIRILKIAEEKSGDPEFSKTILKYVRRIAGQNYEHSDAMK